MMCREHRAVRVWINDSRFVRCEACEAMFREVPFKVGPGSIPAHAVDQGEIILKERSLK